MPIPTIITPILVHPDPTGMDTTTLTPTPEEATHPAGIPHPITIQTIRMANPTTACLIIKRKQICGSIKCYW